MNFQNNMKIVKYYYEFVNLSEAHRNSNLNGKKSKDKIIPVGFASTRITRVKKIRTSLSEICFFSHRLSSISASVWVRTSISAWVGFLGIYLLIWRSQQGSSGTVHWRADCVWVTRFSGLLMWQQGKSST